METIYLEEQIRDHPRTRSICERFPRARKILCERYTEVFNPRSQNFRLQKQSPALILARKQKNPVLPTPESYGLGASRNYYFSHMLNCLYDCRYCFLQGMFQSANYVVFVNYECFADRIRELAIQEAPDPVHFFSGYDCDSLAYEPVTGFTRFIIPVFENLSNSLLELRTKSTQIRALTSREPLANCVVAFSFTPDDVSRALEHGVPSIERRLQAVSRLESQGWKIGLRFDPLIYQEDYQNQYRGLFRRIFSSIDPDRVHSISYGNFRLPQKYFSRITNLYPDEKLFAGPLQRTGRLVSYAPSLESEMMDFCARELDRHVPRTLLHPCTD